MQLAAPTRPQRAMKQLPVAAVTPVNQGIRATGRVGLGRPGIRRRYDETMDGSLVLPRGLLDRLALIVEQAGSAAEHALIALSAINGLRISEALGADIDNLGIERGYRTLTVPRKGGKIVTIPLAPTHRGPSIWVGERLDGPVILRADGQRMDRHAASRIVRRVACRAGLDKKSAPTRYGTHSSPPPSTPASHCATSRKPLARRSTNHDALRPRQRVIGPARHLHRRCPSRRRRTLTLSSAGLRDTKQPAPHRRYAGSTSSAGVPTWIDLCGDPLAVIRPGWPPRRARVGLAAARCQRWPSAVFPCLRR